MIILLTIVHIIVCVFLILVVLLQQGKSQDFSSTFGGGGTQSSFGARSGATLLTKATTVSAVLFMVTSMTLTIMMTNRGSTSVIDENSLPSAAAPAVPDGTGTPATTPADDAAAPLETTTDPVGGGDGVEGTEEEITTPELENDGGN